MRIDTNNTTLVLFYAQRKAPNELTLGAFTLE